MNSLDTFFPVVDTRIGKLGTLICMDGNFPENARALALNGAEIIIRPTAYPEPFVSFPLDLSPTFLVDSFLRRNLYNIFCRFWSKLCISRNARIGRNTKSGYSLKGP